MSIDYSAFEKAQFTERTKDVPVPQLKKFYKKNEKPVWKLRCIGSSEMFYAREAALNSQKDQAEMIEEFISKNLSKETIETVKAQMGLPVDVDNAPIHRDVVLRRRMLMYGSIPKCPENVAVKLSNEYGEVFQLLTNVLFNLYSEGNDPGE